MVLLPISQAAAQENLKTFITIDSVKQYKLDSATARRELEIRNHDSVTASFRAINNALFNQKKYADIIETCKLYDLDYLNSDVNCYLVGAYYAIGSHFKSDSMLKVTLKYADSTFSTYNATTCMNAVGYNVAMQEYLSNSQNWKKVEQLVFEHYERLEKPKNRRASMELWHLLLKDQYIRGQNIKAPERKEEFAIANENNLEEQFNVYKRSGHIFSSAEIGAGLHNEQFFLFAHEGNRERRKWYLELIKAGAKQGLCELRRVPDFILRTEKQDKGPRQFLIDLEQRESEIRKEYNLPDYYYQFP